MGNNTISRLCRLPDSSGVQMTSKKRSRSLEPPKDMNLSFAPFGRVDGLLNWTNCLVEENEDLRVIASDVDLSGSTWRGVHMSSLNLTQAHLNRVRFEDCQSVSATLSKSNIGPAVFDRCLFGYWKFEYCEITRLEVRGGSISGCTFNSCEIEQLVVTEKAKSEKLRFRDSEVTLIHDPATQGNLFFENCSGVAIFSPAGLPNRLFNRSENMSYFVVRKQQDVRGKVLENVREAGHNVGEALEELVQMGVIEAIGVDAFSVAALRDKCSKIPPA